MTLEEACVVSRKRRDLYDMDVHVLCTILGEYFTVLDTNLKIFLAAQSQQDKKIYYSAWKLIK